MPQQHIQEQLIHPTINLLQKLDFLIKSPNLILTLSTSLVVAIVLPLLLLLLLSPSSIPNSLSVKEKVYLDQKTKRKSNFPHLLEKGASFVWRLDDEDMIRLS